MNSTTSKISKSFHILPLRIADKRWFYRLWEIIPGLVSWFFLSSPIIFSFLWPLGLAYFIIAYDLLWLLKSVRMSIGLIKAYRKLQAAKKIDWQTYLKQLKDPIKSLEEAQKGLENLAKPSIFGISAAARQKSNYVFLKNEVARLQQLVEHKATIINPSDIYHVIIKAVYNESLEIIEPSIKALLDSNFDLKKVIFVFAYEQRGGDEVAKNAKYLEEKFANKFGSYLSICHPDKMAGEVIGKGGNITFAGRIVKEYILEQGIEPSNVVVTTLDADHRPDPNYLPYLTYEYCANPNRIHSSFQPMAMFFNNIWDAPAPMRVIATGNSFWLMMESVRRYRLRNFAAHAQSLQTLIDTDFWATNTIVEDGHQYWRTFYTYDGDHVVEPLYIPIYQDAVLADNWRKTFKNQYKQLRRWAYGVSDEPFVVTNNLKNHQIPFFKKWVQFGRLFEGHLSWATAPLIITFAAWAPLFLNPEFTKQVLAHQLPVFASRILTLTLIGLFITICLSLLMLPPRPKHYHKARVIFMVFQWILIPITSICFGSAAALDSQTRLLLGYYPKQFEVTEKAVKKPKYQRKAKR